MLKMSEAGTAEVAKRFKQRPEDMSSKMLYRLNLLAKSG